MPVPIPEQAVRAIQDLPSLLKFLERDLQWKLPDNPTLEEVTFEWSASELRLNESALHKLSGGAVLQLRPMTPDQPWGIFIVNFTDGQVYKTALRQVLRGLVPKRRRDSNLPAWKHENILFICTTANQEFTFAHFRGEKSERAKLVRFSWSPDEPIRTLCEFNLPSLRMREDVSRWTEEWQKAFDVKAVTEEFYEELKKVFRDIQEHIYGVSGERKRSFAQLLINRLLFLKFLEKKGWLFVDEHDTPEQRRAYLRRQREKVGKQNQWQYFFFHLFFNGLNRRVSLGIRELTPAMQSIVGNVPFLNGGLFEQSKEWKDQDVKVDNKVFDEIFGRLLDRYNFTIQENTPLDIEVALNPDLLGYAYEELIAERHGQGAFYTHPTEVGLMCRESLKTYLEEHTNIDHTAIAQLIDEWNATGLTEDEAFSVYRLLLSIKILDLAVGSAAYPVRMMQELVNIHKALAQRMTEGQFRYIFENKLVNPLSMFDLKLNIIQNNLYGVDIDYFAVEIARLRFWLSLVVDFDRDVNTPTDLEHIPALPNLDFKLRVGDSLVATPGRVKLKRNGKTENVLLNLDTHFKHSTPDAFFLQKTSELRRLKEEFFNFEELRKQKRDYTRSKDDLRKQIAQLETDLANSIGFKLTRDVEECKHILWQIHFAEIFSEERFGFDVCIANPPYLRQEKIKDIFERFEMDITKDDLVDTYESLYEHQDLNIDKKSDLYVYFYLRGVNLLKEKGVLCFICSNSWLDVGYGATLQEFLLRSTRIRAIFDNSAQRSFEKADVNTTINVFVKDSSVEKKTLISTTRGSQVDVTSENIVRFVAFRKPLELAAGTDQLRAIESATTITSTNDYRVYPITQKNLWSAGVEHPSEGSNEYAGDKWGGKYLRAPDIFYVLYERASSGKIISLEPNVAKVITVSWSRLGRNEEIFLVKSEKPPNKQRIGAVLKSPREVNRIICKEEDTKFLLLIDEEISNKLVEAPILWVDIRGDKHLCLLNEDNVYFTHNFHGILPLKKYEPWLLTALLSSTMVWLIVEAVGRRGLGGGAVRILVKDLKRTPLVLAPELLSKQCKLVLRNILEGEIGKREIHDAFTECGLNAERSIRSQEPHPLADRKALDDVVFDALGLTAAERNEVYWSVCELVQNRLMKARSV